MIGLGVLALASVGLGWLVSGRALRPVRSITEAARRASELRLGQRLALTGPDDELKQLADTFDLMLERLDAAFTSQKRFVANAAHELRTPLTAMRTAIEVTLSKPTRTPEQLEAMAARVKRSVERAEATIEALLTLATSELGPDRARSRSTSPPPPRTRSTPRTRRSISATSRSRPRSSPRSPAAIGCCSSAWSPTSSRTPCDTTTRAAGSESARSSTRTAPCSRSPTRGPSVSAEQIPTLFEPFARAEQRLNPSDGVGLGLSIAQAIAGRSQRHDHRAPATRRRTPAVGRDPHESELTGVTVT